ncbi:MAG: hypothetical protein WB816_12650 [Methylocystis sp.]
MHYTLEGLLHGDSKIFEHYQAAKRKWILFFETHKNQSASEWAKWLAAEQITFFERRCGGRSLGQEVMAWSGFGALYDTEVGFGENLATARKLAAAFALSMCCAELKKRAEDAAASFHVNDASERDNANKD